MNTTIQTRTENDMLLGRLAAGGLLGREDGAVVMAAAEAASAGENATSNKLWCDKSHWCVVVPS